MVGTLVTHPWSQGGGHCLPRESVGRWWLAGSGAALVPPASGPGITQLRSTWGHPSPCHGCSTFPIPTQPLLHGTSLPAWLDQQHSPVGPSGPARLSPCCHLSSALALLPAWKGEVSPTEAVPLPTGKRDSVPLLGCERSRWLPGPLTWYCGVEAEGSSPAKSDSESSSCSRQ